MSGDPTVDYGALDIADVISYEYNAEIIRDLKDDNPDLDEFWIGDEDTETGHPVFDVEEEDARGMGVLGYYLGRCTHVTELTMQLPADLSIAIIEPFLSELRNNTSICGLQLLESHIPRGDFFQKLKPFFASNPNLMSFDVERCVMTFDQYWLISSALREGRSLKWVCIDAQGIDDSSDCNLVIIQALKMHPLLEIINLRHLTLGRLGFGMGLACVTLADLLRQSAVGMRQLSLCNNDIDDADVEALVEGLANCRGLQKFQLAQNESITTRGWRAVAALLEDPSFSLKELDLQGNGIKDESAIIFANALACNKTLEKLYLSSGVECTGEGWRAFAKVLCDTSSVNSTFLSNHTLWKLTGPGDIAENSRGPPIGYPDDITSPLSLNRWNDKTRVGARKIAVRKILRHHDDIDMQPLFEWDLKVLPFVIVWLEKADAYRIETLPWEERDAAYEIETKADTRKRKLAAIYQFIRGVPELAIDGITGANKKSAKAGGEKRPHSAAFEG